jgi:hypothetical protein
VGLQAEKVEPDIAERERVPALGHGRRAPVKRLAVTSEDRQVDLPDPMGHVTGRRGGAQSRRPFEISLAAPETCSPAESVARPVRAGARHASRRRAARHGDWTLRRNRAEILEFSC